jgi:hypothetical protein
MMVEVHIQTISAPQTIQVQLNVVLEQLTEILNATARSYQYAGVGASSGRHIKELF